MRPRLARLASETIAEAEAPMGGLSSCIGGAGSVPVEHGSVSPSHETQNGIVVRPGESKVVGDRVTQLVNVHRPNAGLDRTTFDGLRDTKGRHRALPTDPEGGRAGI